MTNQYQAGVAPDLQEFHKPELFEEFFLSITIKRLAGMTDITLQDKLHTLLIAISDSDQQAFSDFYDLTINKVYGLVFKILGNHDDSEEVVSDVYSQLWQQTERYDQRKGSILGWCLLIARCRALDLYRKRKSSYALAAGVDVEQLDDLESVDGPETIVQLFQDSGTIQGALEQLNPTQRQLIALAFFRGYTHMEISETTGIPLGSVKSHIRRALLTVQNDMKG